MQCSSLHEPHCTDNSAFMFLGHWSSIYLSIYLYIYVYISVSIPSSLSLLLFGSHHLSRTITSLHYFTFCCFLAQSWPEDFINQASQSSLHCLNPTNTARKLTEVLTAAILFDQTLNYLTTPFYLSTLSEGLQQEIANLTQARKPLKQCC